MTFAVDRSKARAFVRSLDDTDPHYTDREAVRATGFADIPAPPTLVVSSARGRQGVDMLDELDPPMLGRRWCPRVHLSVATFGF